MKPQKTATCASPGAVHCSSFRWPATSTTSARAMSPVFPMPTGLDRLGRASDAVEEQQPRAGDPEQHDASCPSRGPA